MNPHKSEVSEHIALVNSQIQYHKYQAERSEEVFKQDKHVNLVKQFESLLEYLENTQGGKTNQGQNGMSGASRPTRSFLQPKKRIEEHADLPQELVSQLKGIVTYKEKVILEVMRENDGVASIDEILIGIYHKTGEIKNRDNISRRLYNMGKRKGLISRVPKRRGVYQVNPK